MKNNIFLTIMMISMVFLCACGGSSGGGTVSTPSYTLTGIAVDPYIENSIFYLDSNGNGTADEGEPLSSPSDKNGRFGFTSPVQEGDVIRMHPDHMGTHAGREYDGELLERRMNGLVTENGDLIASPLTTMLSKYNMTEEDFCELLNDAADEDIYTSAHLYSDPLSIFAEDTPEVADFYAVQANVMINTYLSGTKGTQDVHADFSALESEQLKENLAKIFTPIMQSMRQSLNNENYMRVKSVLEDEEIPTLDIQHFVYSCIEAHNHLESYINTALSENLHSDLSDFSENLRNVMTQDSDKSGEEILQKSLADYISFYSEDLKRLNKYDSVVSNAGSAANDHDYFSDLHTEEDIPIYTNYKFEGKIKNSILFSEEAMFYYDGNNNGTYDYCEDSEDMWALCDENGEFIFEHAVKDGGIIRMFEHGMGKLNGKDYSGMALERTVGPFVSDEVMVISSLTTIMSCYSVDSNEITAVLENISGNQGIFSLQNIFGNNDIEDINAPTTEISVLRRNAIEIASLVMLDLINEYPELDQAMKDMTSTQVCQLLQGCLEPVAEKLLYIADDDLLEFLNSDIRSAYDLLNNPSSPFPFAFEDLPELEVELIFRSILTYREDIFRIMSPALTAIDVSGDPDVYIPLLINAFSANLGAVADLAQKTSDLLIAYYIKEQYRVLNAEEMLADVKIIIGTLGNQAGFSTLIDSIDESPVISIDSATGNIVVQ
ncbi:MAG: hypothetical protein ACOCWO_01810 [Candidatus Muiribacteriaceae bacterium]